MKNKLIVGAVIIAILIFAFWYGGDAPNSRGWETNTTQAVMKAEEPTETTTETPTEAPTEAPSEVPTEATIEATQDKYHTDPIPKGKPAPVEPQDARIGTKSYTCTISISCDTILDNMDYCEENKKAIVPSDGWILKPVNIEGIANLYEFDVGQLSGWMYSVNDWFPNYGCSRYQLMDGDVIEWKYTCDLGNDVGGGYSSQKD